MKNKILTIAFLVCSTVCTCSCSGNHNSNDCSADTICIDDYSTPDSLIIKSDSCLDSIKQQPQPDDIQPSPANNYGTSAPRHTAPANDNLRGWDPASENDMDDNGVSRFMENDDEEGWN